MYAPNNGCSGIEVISDAAAETDRQTRVYIYGTIAAILISTLLGLPMRLLLRRARADQHA